MDLQQCIQTDIHASELYLQAFPPMPDGWVIESDDEYTVAAGFLGEVKDAWKAMEATRSATVKPYMEAERKINRLFKSVMDKYKLTEQAIKRAMADYKAAIEKARREEEERLRKQAEEERRKLEQELNAAQSETEAAGLQDQLDSLFEPVVAAAPLPDVGVSTRERWKAEVVDFPALVKAVANGTVPNTVLMVNNAALQALARQYKDNKTIPGVRIYRDDVMVART